jgi:hypothetical protein
VRAAVRFTLHLVHGCKACFGQVRAIAFVADLVEITDLFEDHPVEQALGLVFRQRCVLCTVIGVPTRRGSCRPMVARSRYPWSVQWRLGGGVSDHFSGLVDAAQRSQQLGWPHPPWSADPILRVLSAVVMSRAPIRPFPTSPCMVS